MVASFARFGSSVAYEGRGLMIMVQGYGTRVLEKEAVLLHVQFDSLE